VTEEGKSRDNYLIIGAVTKGHGLRGEVRIQPLFRDMDVLASLPALRIIYSDGRADVLQLRSFRIQGLKILVSFEGIHDRTGADLLKGATLAVNRSDLPVLEEGDYYLGDLVGYRVVTDSGEVIGVVQDVWGLPANDVLQVMADDKEVLIPVIDDVVAAIDPDAREIRITPMEGLLD